MNQVLHSFGNYQDSRMMSMLPYATEMAQPYMSNCMPVYGYQYHQNSDFDACRDHADTASQGSYCNQR